MLVLRVWSTWRIGLMWMTEQVYTWAIKIIFILFLHDECFAWMYIWAPHESQVTTEVRRRLTGTEGYKWFWTTTWMLRIKPRFSVKEANAINHWAISVGPGKTFQLYKNVSCQCCGFFLCLVCFALVGFTRKAFQWEGLMESTYSGTNQMNFISPLLLF